MRSKKEEDAEGFDATHNSSPLGQGRTPQRHDPPLHTRRLFVLGVGAAERVKGKQHGTQGRELQASRICSRSSNAGCDRGGSLQQARSKRERRELLPISLFPSCPFTPTYPPTDAASHGSTTTQSTRTPLPRAMDGHVDVAILRLSTATSPPRARTSSEL